MAQAVDLPEQIGGLRQIAARPGIDDRQPGDVQRVDGAAERHDGPRLKYLAQTRDRAIERLDLRPVELPYNVVAPVEPAEHRIERVEARANSLL